MDTDFALLPSGRTIPGRHRDLASRLNATHNDAVTEWVADYDAWLNQGLNCVTTTEGLSPAEWDRWRAQYDAKGAVLLGQARALFGAELGERA